MSSLLTLQNYQVFEERRERAHRVRVYAAILCAVALPIALSIYGFDYYLLDLADRPFSPKHALLKPSGRIGLDLGILGLGMFLLIFLYPLRKRIGWLAKLGQTKHWLDFHIVLGLTAPVVIAFHSSFKFKGIAGMAFWIMVAVALSGIAGRYIYAQIPRSLNNAEFSLKELAVSAEGYTAELSRQRVLSPADLEPIFRMPTADQVRQMPLHRVLLLMIGLDLARPFHVACLRKRVLGWRGMLFSLAGLLLPRSHELERVVRIARHKAALAKRIVFLERSQQVFHFWHVVHRPFSYSFAVLALIHLAVVTMLGFL